MVVLRTLTGRCCRVRTLLDQGAEACIISEDIIQMLQLAENPVDASIFSIGLSHIANAKTFVQVGLRSIYDPNVNVEFPALVLNQLIDDRTELPSQSLPYLKGLKLADPEYGSSTKIDLIIGVEIYGSFLLPDATSGKNHLDL
ncbi:hypothetical protein KPH14_000954 [Odynerus spinipes]|uniref:Peptidase A2 domain-containing protein n=1 Tax=Odynerus spinipes TaxID=1348599 RepID=A0AAD9RE11_9HYME|nr:hypothetical protein KPH14_000954 [Odynerus spinipes]